MINKRKMRKIEGNTACVLMTMGEPVTNAIGEKVANWVNACEFMGILSLQAGDSNYSTHKTKLEESSHILICEYDAEIYAYADQNTRIIAKDRMYDVLLIDNPDELDEHLEIYLRYVGGQNG